MKGHQALDLVHLPGSVAVPSDTEAGLQEEHGFGAARGDMDMRRPVIAGVEVEPIGSDTQASRG